MADAKRLSWRQSVCMHLASNGTTRPANYAVLFSKWLMKLPRFYFVNGYAVWLDSSHFDWLSIYTDCLRLLTRYRKTFYHSALHTRLLLMKEIMTYSIYHTDTKQRQLTLTQCEAFRTFSMLKGCKTVSLTRRHALDEIVLLNVLINKEVQWNVDWECFKCHQQPS